MGANDLYDLMFLSCAAGYADVVAGEHHTSHFLNLAGRQRTDGAAVFGSLTDAVTAVDALLAPPKVSHGAN